MNIILGSHLTWHQISFFRLNVYVHIHPCNLHFPVIWGTKFTFWWIWFPDYILTSNFASCHINPWDLYFLENGDPTSEAIYWHQIPSWVHDHIQPCHIIPWDLHSLKLGTHLHRSYFYITFLPCDLNSFENRKPLWLNLCDTPFSIIQALASFFSRVEKTF